MTQRRFCFSKSASNLVSMDFKCHHMTYCRGAKQLRGRTWAVKIQLRWYRMLSNQALLIIETDQISPLLFLQILSQLDCCSALSYPAQVWADLLHLGDSTAFGTEVCCAFFFVVLVTAPFCVWCVFEMRPTSLISESEQKRLFVGPSNNSLFRHLPPLSFQHLPKLPSYTTWLECAPRRNLWFFFVWVFSRDAHAHSFAIRTVASAPNSQDDHVLHWRAGRGGT